MSIGSNSDAIQSARRESVATRAYQRLTRLFDDGLFDEIDAFARTSDGYAEVVVGAGKVNGTTVFAYAQNGDRAGGAMSKAQAAKIKKMYDLALKTGSPVVAVYDSIGGRLDQESEMLGAYGDILKYSNNLSGVVPQISLVLGYCCGTQALIAVSGDIVIMSEEAQLTLNTDGSAASAEDNKLRGTAHIVESSENKAIQKTRELLALLPSNNLEIAGNFEYADAAPVEGDTVSMLLDGDSAVELQKNYGTAVSVVLGTIEGSTVGVVSCVKKDLDGKSCSKAARFIRFCDAFGIPVVSLINAERFSCIKSAAKLTSAYAEATTGKVTIITGTAIGAVYVAMAGTAAAADITLAWADACISALEPEAAAVIALGDDLGGRLKGSQDPKADREKIVQEFKATELTALKAAYEGYVQDVIEPSQTRAKVAGALEILADKRVTTLPKKHNNLYI